MKTQKCRNSQVEWNRPKGVQLLTANVNLKLVNGAELQR